MKADTGTTLPHSSRFHHHHSRSPHTGIAVDRPAGRSGRARPTHGPLDVWREHRRRPVATDVKAPALTFGSRPVNSVSEATTKVTLRDTQGVQGLITSDTTAHAELATVVNDLSAPARE